MARIKYYDSDTQQWVYGDMAVCLPSSRLPAEYQEVEHIESTGTQYIDTGLTLNDFTAVSMTVQFNAITSSPEYCGLYDDNNSRQAWGFGLRGSTGKYAWIYPTTTGSDFVVEGVTATTNKVKLQTALSHYNGGYLISDNTNTSTASNIHQNTGTVSFYIGARNKSGTASELCNAKFYEVSFFDWLGIKVAEFIPCYRKADGEIGMYDTVNGVFYTNSGSGTFTKGADV